MPRRGCSPSHQVAIFCWAWKKATRRFRNADAAGRRPFGGGAAGTMMQDAVGARGGLVIRCSSLQRKSAAEQRAWLSGGSRLSDGHSLALAHTTYAQALGKKKGWVGEERSVSCSGGVYHALSPPALPILTSSSPHFRSHLTFVHLELSFRGLIEIQSQPRAIRHYRHRQR